MRNNYRIENGIAIIEIVYKNKLYETRVNKSHLDTLLSIDVRWGISLVQPNNLKYVVTAVEGKTVYLHRLVSNAPKGKLVDHVNHNTLDNTDDNLNIVTQFENQQNLRGASRNNKTGVLGVSWDKFNNKYRASIMVGGKQKNLGRFDDIKDAIEARKEAELKYFPYLASIANTA